jgi:glucose-6-phosphate 1-epimerase
MRNYALLFSLHPFRLMRIGAAFECFNLTLYSLHQVFGTAPDHEATSKLPQHGFARNSRWEFLGKSTSESSSSSVKLDFGLSSENLDDTARQLWPYKFGLLYSVTLSPENLSTALVITNEGDVPFEFQTLLHTYFRIKVLRYSLFHSFPRLRVTNANASLQDISSVQVTGLEDSPFHDKVDGVKGKTQSSDPIAFSGETDRVYTPVKGPGHPVVISDGGAAKFRIVRDNLDDVVVWNPWTDKAAGMADFQPKDGWKNMVCAEAGAVSSWHQLEKGDAFEGAQTIYLN